jgi:hypothetical protein
MLVLRVLTGNSKIYRGGGDCGGVCVAVAIRRQFTKPGCRWTNGKAERLNRIRYPSSIPAVW